MGYASFLEVVNGRFYADAISRFDQADISLLFVKDFRTTPSLSNKFCNMDMVISFVSDKEQIFVPNLKSAGVRCVAHCDPLPPDDGDVHVIDYFLKFVDSLGVAPFCNKPKVFLTDEDVRFADGFFMEKGAGSNDLVVAVHPGSGGRQKCWPLEQFSELIRWLKGTCKAHVFLVSGPADLEIVGILRKQEKDSFSIIDRLSLPHLAAVLKRCNLFIGNDSGVTHLSAAVGAPTIAIFGPTSPNVWGPRGGRVEILYKKISCSPCLPEVRRNCLSPRCLQNVGVDDVVQVIMGIIGNFPGKLRK